MVFARLAYEEEPQWGVIEGKYFRLTDGAPYDNWNYLGTEVRIAHAKLFPPFTGALTTIRLDTGTKTHKAVIRVPAPGAELACPKDGMDCLCGLAALIGGQDDVCAYAAFGGGAIGPCFSEELPADATLTVRVNGEARETTPIVMLREALQSALSGKTRRQGDVIAVVSAMGHLRPGDLLEVTLTGAGTMKNMVRRR